MYDGSSKLVEDIKVNDRLMGDDDSERIKKLHSGEDNMFDITNIENNEENYEVNSSHLISLKASGVSMDENIKWINSKNRWRIY